MSHIQHKEWLILVLLSHIILPLMQQNIAMKLEASPIGENAVHMNHIQTHPVNLTLQLQDIKKGKEHCEEVWCTLCHIDEHTRINSQNSETTYCWER